MSDKKYSIRQVAEIVHSEGLDYAVQHYLSADSIEDLQLAGLWATAKTALDAIDKLLPSEDELFGDDGEGPEDGA